MSLRVVVAAPYRQRGVTRLAESEFVVGLSLDRDWYSPDQASRITDLAISRGLLRRDGDALLVEFDPDTVTVPADFTPDESLLLDRSPFEQTLEALVDAGFDKQEAVAGINRLQAELAITVEAAAVVFARKHGIDTTELAMLAQSALVEETNTD